MFLSDEWGCPGYTVCYFQIVECRVFSDVNGLLLSAAFFFNVIVRNKFIFFFIHGEDILHSLFSTRSCDWGKNSFRDSVASQQCSARDADSIHLVREKKVLMPSLLPGNRILFSFRAIFISLR